MYRGIHNLRSVDDDVTITNEQLQELKKCSADPVYFFENYCYISSRDGWHKFRPRKRQLEEIPALESEKMIKSDWYRQSGYTTLVLSFMLWKAMFKGNTACLYMIPKKEHAYANFNEIVRRMYLALPIWLQPGVKEWTEQLVRFANGSIFCARAASADNAAGIGWDYVFIDEFGWIKDKAMVEIVNSMFPCYQSSARKHLILGQSHRFGRQTPANLLFWKNTTLPFHVSEFTWDQDDRLDENWATERRAWIGDKNFEKEYCGRLDKEYRVDGTPERFDKWTVWKEGLWPDVDRCPSGKYICAVVKFSTLTGLPVAGPYTRLLPVCSPGVCDDSAFAGLSSNAGTYEKVVAWMPAPEVPVEVAKTYRT